jgi:phospholipid transport system substrate-binding protein
MKRRSSHVIRAALVAAALVGLAGAGQADPGAPSGARALIATTVDDVLVILNDPKLDRKARLTRLEAIAHERFDFVTMSQLVVARYWKTFTPEQQTSFVEEFKTFLARSYGDRIDRYTNEKVEIVGEAPAPAGDRTVMTQIVGGEYGGAEVEYRLREKSGVWRVIDVKVEGISLVLNYRDQFSSVLSRDGAEGLLGRLRKKNTEPVPAAAPGSAPPRI